MTLIQVPKWRVQQLSQGLHTRFEAPVQECQIQCYFFSISEGKSFQLGSWRYECPQFYPQKNHNGNHFLALAEATKSIE